MAATWLAKGPGEVVDYAADFSPKIPADDEIATVDASVVDTVSGLVINSKAKGEAVGVPTGKAVILWFSGGNLGKTAKVLITATTVKGRTVQGQLSLPIRTP